MKYIYTIIISLALGLTSLNAAAFEKNVKYRGYKLTLTSDKPITVGNNLMDMSITKKGNKIDFKSISLKVFMPAMPGMPAMKSITEAEHVKLGEYSSNLNFSMSGTWQIHIFLTPKTGKKIRIKTSLNI